MIATASRGAIRFLDHEGSGCRGIDRNEPPAINGGNDAWQVAGAAEKMVAFLRETVTWQVETPEQKFVRYAERWRAETGFMSSARDMATHESYQRIIGMGLDALPFILSELRERPDHWFWALNAITGIDPVPACDRGKIERMRDAWINWADTQDDLRR